MAACAATWAVAAAASPADGAAGAHQVVPDTVRIAGAQGRLDAWQPLVRHRGAELRFVRAGPARARVLRLSDRRDRAGYVTLSSKVDPHRTVIVRADLNLVRQRLRPGGVRPLVAVSGRDGTSYQAGVMRRASGGLAWAVWVKTAAGRRVGLRAGRAAQVASWNVVTLQTRWASRGARATLVVDGKRLARTPPRDLTAVAGERVIVGLGGVSALQETGTLLLRTATTSASGPLRNPAAGGASPAPSPAPAPPAPTFVPGDFQLLPRGAPLLSDRDCAARVLRSTREPRAENFEANHLTPGDLSLADNPDFDAEWNATFRPRVSGAFIGTTDEIIQWSACKWGLSVDLLRAQAVEESLWRQSAEGDLEDRSDGNCTPDDATDPCPTSFGLLQNKWYFNRAAYPMLRTMTSFHMDWSAAKLRGCFEGNKGGVAGGDFSACLGEWFSGRVNDAAAGDYVRRVQAQAAARAWTGWPDESAGIPYRTGLVE